MDTSTRSKAHPGNIILGLIALLVVITAIYYFTGYFLRDKHFLETNDAQVESYINPISARTGGYIKKVLFEEHQVVKSGDTLVILDDRENRQRVTEA